MKKVVAGHWVTEDQKYDIHRNDLGFWSVGMIIDGQRQHLEDVKTIFEGRIFIAEHQKQKRGEKNE